MAFFKSRGFSTTSGDPFFDAVISYAATENTEYVGVNAIRNSDVFTAIKILASDIATNPIMLKENGIDVMDSNLYHLLNVQPNQFSTAFHFKFALIANMLLNGNSYARIKKLPNGQPYELEFLPVSTMTVKLTDNNIQYVYQSDDGSQYTLKKEDVLHFKYFTADGLSGISPLLALKKEIAMIDAGNNTLLNFFKQGINSSGILEVKQANLNAEAKQNIREKFEEANAGDENAQRTIIVDSTMKYTPIQVNTEVLQLVNNNVYSTKQIAKAFGIPLERFGMELVNTSSEAANLSYLQNTLSHYFAVFTSELNIKLLSYPDNISKSFAFNTNAILQVSEEKLIELLTKSVQGSMMTINEARKRLGLQPVEGGDTLIVSLNYAQINNFLKGEGKADEEG